MLGCVGFDVHCVDLVEFVFGLIIILVYCLG